MSEAAAVARDFLVFIDGFTSALIDRYFGKTRDQLAPETIDLSEVAIDNAEVDIPYFVKNPRR